MQSAAELHRRGVTAINRGRARQARSLLVRARERADSEDLLSRIDASMAYVAAETGDPAEAIRLCELARSREGIAPETRGIVESQLAGLRMRRGETAAALASFEIAIGSLDDATELARAHVNRGGVYLQQGLAAPAADDFAAAVAHFSAAGRDVDAAMAEHNLGYAHLLRGDLAAAYQRMEAARLVLQDVSPIVRAIGDQDRAEVLLAAGLVSEGVEALGSAAREFGRRRLQQRRAEAELALARAVLLADPERSLAAARSARRRFARAGQEAWRARAEALAVAAEVETGRRGPSLVRRSDEVAAQLEEQGLSTNATLARLRSALVQVRRGDLDDAAERLSRERVGRSAPLTVQLLASTVRVELARSQGRPGVALRQARQGLDRLHAWQSTLGSLDVQTSVVGRGERLAVHALEIATESARPEVVLEWSERGRMLASRVRPVRPPSDPALAEQLAELRRLQSGEDDLSAQERRRHTELRRTVRERALQLEGSGEVAAPADLAEVHAALGPDQALVAFVASAGSLVAMVTTDSTAAVRRICGREELDSTLGGLHADLDMAGSELPAPFAGPVRRQLASRLDRLDDLLVAPIADLVGDRRLVLTPSGVLAGVPWGLLPSWHGRPVTVSRSATSWLAGHASPLRLGSAGFVAGPRVARAAGEVKAAAETWEAAEVLVGEAASASAVSELAGRVDVLHVSAHGRHSAENPLFSGLELVDGPWFGYDIDQLAAIPEVVLLSACEVGRSEVRFGEELVGMTTAWLHAGARCVIASAAAVNDGIAHDVLVAVHRGLGAGQDPATALAAALPAVSEESAPAPFVCFC